MCCKVMSIGELGKPQGKWCKHCDIGNSCKVYTSRPQECRDFYCGYLTWRMLGEHWLPSLCKMVVVFELGGTRVAVHVDASRPSAWREEPFYSDMKEWAQFAAAHMHQVIVCVGDRTTVILPDRDVDLGAVADDERIITVERRTASGSSLDALKLKADDPRIAGMEPGKIHRPDKGTL